MLSGPRLLRAAVLPAVAGTALVVVPAPPAHAAACSGSSGVSVVVDFASLGGGTQTGCAAGDPATGLAALRAAGFEPTRAAQQPGYFVCRINGRPANDPCQRASPADAYWSYWHAQPGGSWTFSNEGPAEYDPRPGTVEGWAFGAGKPPSSPPPSRSQPSATPSPRASARPVTAAPPARAAASPSVTRTRAVAAPAPASARPSPSVAASAAAAPSPSPAPTASPSPLPSESPVEAAPARRDDDPGSPWGPLLTALIVSVLVTGAAREIRRRRGAI